MQRLRLLLYVSCFLLVSTVSRKELNWIAIGDSITYLNDHLDETGNRVTKGYMTRVVEKLPHIHYKNQGHNGWTAGRIAQQIDKLGLEEADIYSVFLGTNDWWAGRPLGSFKDYQGNTGNQTVYGSFRLIINKLKQLNPKASIILITPMQRVDFVYLFNHKNNAFGSYKPKNGQYLEAFAQAIDSVGHYEQLPVVDLYHLKSLQHKKLVKYKRLKSPHKDAYVNYKYPKFVDQPYNPEIDEYPYPFGAIDMTYDGLHPSDKGYEVISRQLLKLMEKF
jgi:lysophospholipase L1-like esterase